MERFPDEVAQRLGYYVYRLIDPRYGETFYVGKGQGNRIFDHAKDRIALGSGDEQNLKLSRIREIKNAGFEVAHVVHRHGLNEGTALEVEAALMDAYPGLTNISGGHGSADRGRAHVNEIVNRYAAEPVSFRHSCLEVLVSRLSSEASIYHVARFAWPVAVERARQVEYVLAVDRGMVVEVFEPTEWLPATPENFPDHVFPADPRLHRRWGFVGTVAPEGVRALYVSKRMPPRLRGAAGSIRYFLEGETAAQGAEPSEA